MFWGCLFRCMLCLLSYQSSTYCSRVTAGRYGTLVVGLCYSCSLYYSWQLSVLLVGSLPLANNGQHSASNMIGCQTRHRHEVEQEFFCQALALTVAVGYSFRVATYAIFLILGVTFKPSYLSVFENSCWLVIERMSAESTGRAKAKWSAH